jgi:hypothetical protein
MLRVEIHTFSAPSFEDAGKEVVLLNYCLVVLILATQKEIVQSQVTSVQLQ